MGAPICSAVRAFLGTRMYMSEASCFFPSIWEISRAAEVIARAHEISAAGMVRPYVRED